ncbi:MAG: FliM/FliN family flagellar motor switch protein [Acidobacteriia bacterium]|nr:FliM/FliN family flagellar motor switch protein [Terriglobia bacterium]
MEKVLNQEEIDAMVRAARGGGGGAHDQAHEAVVVPWDVRSAGQIGREQVQAISTLHESFARNLTYSVGAYLRVAFTAALVSAEHLTYGEFLQRVPEVTYLATCKLAPVGTAALLQLELGAAFPLIDVLLGGKGAGAPPERQVTGIEEQILESVMRIICRELQNTWTLLSLEFDFEQRRQPGEARHLMSPEEKTLSLSFELTVAENRGTLNLVFPAVVSNALLRKMSAEWAHAKRRALPDSSQRLRVPLLECPFRVELGIKIGRVSASDLMGLSPGGLLALQQPVEQPATLRVGDCEMFTGMVARRGTSRAAQVLERCSIAPERKPSP